jgi:hypothetical protein
MEMEELTAKLEAFLAAPTEQASGEGEQHQEVVEALDSFYATNDKRADTASTPGEGLSPDFVARFGWATRASFVAALLGNLRAPSASPAGTTASLGRTFELN